MEGSMCRWERDKREGPGGGGGGGRGSPMTGGGWDLMRGGWGGGSLMRGGHRK